MDAAIPPLPPYIKSIEQLREHLQAAIELEHSTIPPYLCAMYTIRPGANLIAAEIIRTVLVEEMLHMVLAANVLNAVGGAPVIDDPRFVPAYPARLPVGKTGPLEVNLYKFSPEAVETFLAIERPAKPPAPRRMALVAGRAPVPVPPGQLPDMIRRGEIYRSIGDFYEAIEQGLRALEARAKAQGATIFDGEADRQISSEYYYNSGGAAFPVGDLATALRALEQIVDQGEGYEKQIFDGDDVNFGQQRELAHYYRFNQIALGRCYREGDTPASGPTGDTFTVSYGADAVWDMMPNPSLAKLPEGGWRARGRAFSRTYTTLLRMIHQGVNGQRDQLVAAVVQMFTLKDAAIELVRNPLPDAAGNAGPCFEFANDGEALSAGIGDDLAMPAKRS